MRLHFFALAAFVWSALSGAVALDDDLQQQLENGLAEARENAGLVGAGGIVLRDGEIAALAVDGVRRKGWDDLIETDDLWHVGSITKSMTATLIARLVEEEVLSFESPLPELLPEMAGDMDEGWAGVTLHHLLNHTSGSPANFPVTTQFIWPNTPEELVSARAKQVANILGKAPKSAAGEVFVYSNVGFSIAGHIAESVTGIPYEELMQVKVFQPLGITSAGFGAPAGDNPWGHSNRLFMKLAMDPEDRADNTPIMAPAGRAHMNLEDLALYGQRHLQGGLGQDDFLTRDSYQKLHTPFLDDYAYGWIAMDREWADGWFIWHNGTNTMWYALLLVLPEKNLVMAFTTNDGRFREAEQSFFDLALELAASSSQSSDTEQE